MASTEKLLEDTKKTIRSLLLSCKDGQTLRHLSNDHQDIMGFAIPHQKLGFSSLPELLRGLPDVCYRTMDRSGQEVYKVVADENTAHIANLVKNQRSKKRARGGRPPRINYNRRPASGSSYRPSSKYVPQRPSSYKSSYRPASSYSQPINTNIGSQFSANSSSWKTAQSISYNQSQQSQTGTNPRGSAHSRLGMRGTIQSKPAATFSNNTTTSLTKKAIVKGAEHTEEQVRSNIKSLMNKYETGIWLHMISDMYEGEFNSPLNGKFIKLIPTWTDIFEPETMHGKMILYKAPPGRTAPQPAVQSLSAGKIDLTAPIPVNPYQDVTISTPDALQLQVEERVYVAHIEADKKLYIHRNDSPITLIMPEIETYCTNNPYQYNTQPPNQSVCLARDSKFEVWCRGYITLADDKKAQIFFVDFGNSEILPLSSIRPLPSEFSTHAAQAIPCVLYNITTGDFSVIIKELKSMTDDTELIAYAEVVQDGLCHISLITTDYKLWMNKHLVDIGVAEWSDKHLVDNSYGSNLEKLRAACGTETQQNTKELSSENISSSDFTSEAGSTAEEYVDDGNDQYWNVYITHINSLQEIYLAKQTHASNLHQRLLSDQIIVDYLSSAHSLRASMLNIGELYVAHTMEDGDDVYNRVTLTQLVDRQTTECFYVDLGCSDLVPTSELYNILPQYKNIPPQAVKCSLYGLDHIEETKSIRYQLEELTKDKFLIAQVVTVDDGVAHVQIFDTNGDTDIDINQEIGKCVQDEELKLTLPEVNKYQDVFITYLESDGRFFIQSPGPGTAKLLTLMTSINDHFKGRTKAEDFVPNPSVGDMVCCKYENIWYRAVIQQVKPEKKQVTVYYCDYGNCSTVSNSSLRKLPKHIEHADSLPHQVLACRLCRLDYGLTDDMIIHCTDLINNSVQFKLKTVKPGEKDEPGLVELYRDIKGVQTSLYEELLNLQSTQHTSSPTDSENPSSTRTVRTERLLSLNEIKQEPTDSLELFEINPITKQPVDYHVQTSLLFKRSFSQPQPTQPNIERALSQPASTPSYEQTHTERQGSMQSIHSDHMRNRRPSTQSSHSITSVSSISPSRPQPVETTDAARGDGWGSAFLNKSAFLDKSAPPSGGSGDAELPDLVKLNINIDHTNKASTRVKLPEVGEIFQFNVIEPNFPGSFICIPSLYAKQLNELTTQLSLEMQTAIKTAEYTPHEGELVACRWSDGVWYRAEYKDKQRKQKHMVLFVDCGTYWFSPISEIKKLPDRYLTIPQLAIKTAMSVVQPYKQNIWSNEARNDFKKLIEGHTLEATVCEALPEIGMDSSFPMLKIKNVHPSDNPSLDIGAKLVELGHAESLT